MSKHRLAACAVLCVSALAAPGASAQAAPLPNLDLSLTSSSVAVSGSTVSGAVNVVATSAKGLKEPSPTLVRLNPGATPKEFEALLAKGVRDPNAIDKVGAIVFDAEGRPGGTVELQTELEPGTYVALNVEGENPKNPPHTVFTVTAAAAPAALPAPAATVRTIDFAFTGPATLKTGELVRFENEGFLVHMDIAFPVRSRRAGLRAIAALRIGNQRALRHLIAGEPVGFFGPLSTGAFQQGVIDAKPGWYVQACFMDTQDHREHTRLGMERLLHIVS